ncbi:hypothetical protein JHK87_030755 [Glycine soja]|nr:hypothetical protein JHK87_030755 [Glycine soja]
MAFKGYLYILIGVFTLVISSSVNITQAVAPSLNRTSFPPGFIFGTASSAYQEDVGIMKYMNTDAYRFSISWSRILPNLLPFVTLFHWDLPQALQDDYGGFLSPHIMFMQPLTTGNYPETMQSLLGSRLPNFTEEQSKLLIGSFDFVGLNYYTTTYAAHIFQTINNTSNTSYFQDTHINFTTERNGTPIGPRAASSWLYVYPRGLRELLLYIKMKYNNPVIYITENGMDESNDPTLSLEEALMDTCRIDYFYRHLYYILIAIKDGVKVQGYFAWSLLDNFEWSAGYTLRFGINFVDYKDNLKRHQKLSAHWFRNFLQKY